MLAVLVTATVIATLYFAREVFVPITLAILLSFLLAPAVRALRRLRVGRVTAVGFTALFAFIALAAFAAVVVMTLYINDPRNSALYHHASRLWLVVPVLLLWLSQVWMLASRGEMHDDPVVFAITDRRSLLLGVLMAAVIWWAL